MLVVTAELDVEMDELDEETVLEILDTVVEEAGLQAPAIDGTALGPEPIATRFVPQSAALAR